MLTYTDFFVGLWLVPVVLCILVPLAMLSVWSVIHLSRIRTKKIRQISESAKEKRGRSFTKGFTPSPN